MKFKDKGVEIILEPVLVGFPSLDKPVHHKDFPESPPRYKVTLYLTAEQTDHMKTVAFAHLKSLGVKSFDEELLYIRPVSEKSISYHPQLAGMYAKTCSSGFAIPCGVLDPEAPEGVRVLLPEQIEQEIYAGCSVFIKLKFMKRDATTYPFYPVKIIKVSEGEKMGREELHTGFNAQKYGVTVKKKAFATALSPYEKAGADNILQRLNAE